MRREGGITPEEQRRINECYDAIVGAYEEIDKLRKRENLADDHKRTMLSATCSLFGALQCLAGFILNNEGRWYGTTQKPLRRSVHGRHQKR